MRKLKLLFACLLMTVLGIGQLWADNAAVGATLWAENFAHFGTNTPSATGTGSGTTIFGGATITYAQSSTNTKGYNETLAGGTAPELLLSKSNQTWTISGIPTGGATEMALSFLSNKTTFAVTTSSASLSISGSQKSWTITVKDGEDTPATFDLVIKNTGGSNARIDDVALTVVTAAAGTIPDVIVKTLKSIEVTGMTTTYDQNAAFSFDGICTATYSVTKNDEPQADEEETVTPTSVSTPDMSTVGEKTITVSYTENEVTKSTTYNITVAAAEGDKLTRETTGVTGNSYTDWSEKTVASDAVYAGQSAGGNESIQLRSKNSNSGIISTTSGGLIKKVKVVWNSNTSDGAVLNVYGSNTAYTAASDLYGDNKGTLLGTIVNGTSTQLEITGDYEYVGVRSNSGAMYLESITFVWEAGKQLESIAVKTNPDKVSYNIGDAFDATGLVITASYDNSTSEDIAYAGNEDKFSFTGFSSAAAAAAQAITVTYGGKSTTFDVEIKDVTLQTVTVSGTPATTSYTAGDTFDPAGLTVMGHYSDNSEAEITSGITWSYPDANNTLIADQTSIRVVATVEEIASAAYTVEGLTVTAAPLVASWVAKDQSYENGQEITSATFGPNDAFTITFDKGSNNNAPKYYTTGEAVRAYNDNSFTLSSTDYKFTQIVVTFASGEGSNAISTNVDTYENGTWTGNSKEVVFTIGGTSGHRRIASITVTYEEALPSVETPTFSVAEGTYFETQNVTITTATAGATIYYTTDGTEPTTGSSVYSDPIAVSTNMTIKAIAVKDGLENSAVASATYAMGPIFASLQDLVAADLTSNTMVKVSFSNVAIKKIDTNKKYVTFDIQKEEKDIEIYFSAETLPTTWVVGGTLSGTILAPWKRFSQSNNLVCWELAPESGWQWTDLTYNSPITKTIDYVTVSGTATKTEYVDGEVFDPAGLTVTLYYTDETNEVVTEGILWAPTTALTEGMTSVNVTATVNDVTSAALPVDVTVTAIPTKTIAEFIAAGGGRCYLVGVVSNLTNNNKNCTLTDNSGEILLYNISQNGAVTNFVTLEVEEGDRIKVIATTYQVYNQKDEVVAPEFVKELAPEVVAVTGVTVAPTTATVKVGKTVTLTATVQPALATNTNVTWESDNTEVATVDENGVVTGVAEGTAQITVTTEENNSFTATATITVEAAPSFTGGEWVLVTDVAQLNMNDYIIIANAEYNKAMSSTQNSNNRGDADVTIAGGILTYESAPAIFTLKAGNEGGQYAFYDEDVNGYLFAASSSSNWLRTQETVDANASWTITITDGVASVVAQGTNTHNLMQYNNSSKIFSCYNNDQKAIALYKYYSTPALKLTYDMNGGTGAIANAIANGENQVTITSTIPERVGYNFTGWNTASDGSGIGYTAGNVVTLTANLTLYAQWDDEPVDGEEMVIIVKNGDKYYAMGQVVISGNRMNAVELTDGIIGDKMINVPTEDRAAITWIRKEKNDGFTFQAQNGKYLVGNNSTDLKLGDEPTLWKFDAENGYYYTMLSGTKRTFIQGVVSGTEVFRNYDANLMNTGNYSGVSVYLNEYIDIDNTKEIVTLRSGLENGKIGTMCWNADIYEVEGAYFFEPEMKQADGVCFAEAAKEGGVYPMGKPYVFQATGEEIRAVVSKTNTTTVAGTNNGLHGVLGETVDVNGENYYIIYQNRLYTANNNYIVANRAYIVKSELPGASANPAPNRRRLVIGRDNLPTGIEAIVLNAEQVKKVLVDGQIYIVRDGKLYDLTGKVVR